MANCYTFAAPNVNEITLIPNYGIQKIETKTIFGISSGS